MESAFADIRVYFIQWSTDKSIFAPTRVKSHTGSNLRCFKNSDELVANLMKQTRNIKSG